jgi:nucleoside-diphosphate-sugar epimerase
MKIAITGASGFIGRNCLDHWPDALSFDKRITTHHITHCQDMLWGENQIYDFAGVDAVVHLASETSVRSGLSCKELLRINVGLAMNVYESCVEHKVPLMINASSSSVYGNIPPPFSEEQVPHPMSNYSVSKLAAEHWLNLAADQTEGSGPSIVNLRLFNALGSYQRENMFPYIILDCLRLGVPVPLFSEMYRAWTPVDYIVKCIDMLITEGNYAKGASYTFNYGNNTPLTQVQFIAIMADKLNIDIPTEKVAGGSRLEMAITLPDVLAIRRFIDPPLPGAKQIGDAIADVFAYYNSDRV